MDQVRVVERLHEMDLIERLEQAFRMVADGDLFDGIFAKPISIENMLAQKDSAPGTTTELLDLVKETRVVALDLDTLLQWLGRLGGGVWGGASCGRGALGKVESSRR